MSDSGLMSPSARTPKTPKTPKTPLVRGALNLSRMRGEGFSFMFGGLGVKVCSLEVGLPTATVPELLAIAAKVVNF
jgi:hypothetical protein